MTRTLDPDNKLRQTVLRAYRENPSASLRELVQATGYSQTAVYYHLSNLRNEGVITRENKPRGQYARKYNSAKTCQKKAETGRKGKGGDAFTPRKSKKDTGLQQRIDLVVKMAKEKEKQGEQINFHNVVMHSPIRLSGASKVG